jgi:diguanylate cyclase (GGDEF)-like protein/PAS domain S-box-containing protein
LSDIAARPAAGRKGPVWLWSRLSLVARVMLTASCALVVAGLVLLFMSTGRDVEFSRAQLAEHLESEVEALLPAIAEWVVIGDYANIDELLRQHVRRSDVQRVAWTTTAGKTLEARDKAVALRAPEWFVAWSAMPAPRADRALVIGGRSYGEVTIEMTAAPQQNHLWDAFLGHIAILALALVLDFLGILLILKTGLRPVAALSRGALALEAGQMSARIEPGGAPELAGAVAAFNRMAVALQAAQEELREDAERLMVTLASIGDGVIATDADGKVEFMNSVAETLTGWSAAAAAGRPVREVFAIANESTRQEVECPVGRALRAGATVTLAQRTLLIARDGSERPVADSAAPIRHVDGRVTGAVLVFRDQSADRRALDRLALAASVSDHALNGVIITDADQRIVEVNPAFSRITGYSRDEALGQTPRLLASGRQDASFYQAMWAEIEMSGHWRGEIWNRHKDGRVYPEDLTVVQVRDEDGSPLRYIGIFTDISQVKAQEAQLRHLAHYDQLTGLPNRALLADRMGVALAQSERSGERLAVCYLDLDHFKPINDRFGHAAGDRLLQEVARRLREALRGGDTVARLGGDEFVLLLVGMADVAHCQASLDRVLHCVTQPIAVEGSMVAVTASIGATIFPDDQVDADTLLRHADQSLYAAKDAGRNRAHIFNPRLDDSVRERRASLARLDKALAAGEFVLHYQPKVDMRAGTVLGVEALIRWRHPERGLLLPEEFLHVLDHSELEIRLGEWVIASALAQMEQWRAGGLDLAVSVNIAPPHLARADFTARLQELIELHAGTPRSRLELEVLESVALDDIAHVSGVIEACQRIGVAFALDDFGTGYSSLSYLKHLHVDRIKIDQSFISDMLGNPEEQAIVGGVIGLANAFHIEVLAEGVETVAQARRLTELGCDQGQGYGIARPMPAEDVPRWVAGWSPDPAWREAMAA